MSLSILDRPAHYLDEMLRSSLAREAGAHIVQISGDSYRLKDKRKAGTLRAPKAS